MQNIKQLYFAAAKGFLESDMEKYFITLIVPVYKVDYPKLKKCLSSISAQTADTSSFEVLLIDDGSPDECPAICDAYAQEHSNVRVIHQKNQGLSVVRNVGVNNAAGEWISFVDGDDWLEPDYVEFAMQAVKQAPADADLLIWDGYSETPKAAETIRFMNWASPELHIYKNEKKEKVIERILPRRLTDRDIRKCTCIGVTWARIYRRDLLIDNHIENVPGLRVMQDSVFNLWVLEYARTVCYQFKPVYHYSMYDASISKKYDPTVARTMQKLYGFMAEYISKCHNNDEYWQRLYVLTVRLLVKCLSKDYANPQNRQSLQERCAKMEQDLSAPEFQTALSRCELTGQDFKFKVIAFLLKNHMYPMAIMTSQAFGGLRRLKNNVS